MQEVTNNKIISPTQQCENLQIGRTTLWRKVRSGEISPPIELGANSVGFYESEIVEWLVNRRRRSPISVEVE